MIKGGKEKAKSRIGKEDFVSYILLDLAGRYGDLFPSLRDCYELEDCKRIAETLYTEDANYGYQFDLDGHTVLFFLSDRDAENAAISVVEEMLKDEPELFNRDWLNDYLYMSDTDIRLLLGDLDEIYSEQDYTEEEIEEKLEEAREELENNPLRFLVDELGYDEESAFKMLRINYEEAAEAAVNIDGWSHFLGNYDGNGWEVSIPEGGLVRYTLVN